MTRMMMKKRKLRRYGAGCCVDARNASCHLLLTQRKRCRPPPPEDPGAHAPPFPAQHLFHPKSGPRLQSVPWHLQPPTSTITLTSTLAAPAVPPLAGDNTAHTAVATTVLWHVTWRNTTPISLKSGQPWSLHIFTPIAHQMAAPQTPTPHRPPLLLLIVIPSPSLSLLPQTPHRPPSSLERGSPQPLVQAQVLSLSPCLFHHLLLLKPQI